MHPFELCWLTGKNIDACDCEHCEHKAECSGYLEKQAEKNKTADASESH